MTKEERKYLRAIYHHFDELHIRGTNTPHPGELANEWRKFKLMTNLIYLVLTLKVDVDGQSKEELDEAFRKHKIQFMD